MKKSLSLTLCFGLLFTLLSLASVKANAQENTGTESANSGASLTLEPKTGTYKVGEEFELQVKLSTGGVESDNVEILMTYDPKLLEAVDASAEDEGLQISGSKLYETELTNLVNAGKGTIDYSALSLDPSNYYKSNAPEVLATLKFKVLAVGTAKVAVTFSGEDGDETDSNVYAAEDNKDFLEEVTDAELTLTAGETVNTNVAAESDVDSAVEEESSVDPEPVSKAVVSSLLLTSSSAVLPSDGKSTATLTVTVLDADSKPMKGELLEFSLDGSGDLAETVLTSNAEGRASTVYTAGTKNGEVKVVAESKSNKSVTQKLLLTLEEAEVLPVPGEVPVEATKIVTAKVNTPNNVSNVGPTDLALVILLAALTLTGISLKLHAKVVKK